ncbi:MAG: hypothetical protein AB1925_22780 [Actinomycetota bacterium]
MTTRTWIYATVSVGILILSTLLTPPIVNADTLPNGLAVTCTQDSDVHATCVVSGCPRVNGDYVVDAVHAMINGGAQQENDFKCINGQTARYGVDNNRAPINIGVQACRKHDFSGDDCTPYANYTFTPPEVPKPAAPVTCPAGSPTPTVPAGQTCAPVPVANVTCPAGSPTPTVPAGQTCAPVPVAPKNAVTMNIVISGLSANVDVASSADIPGSCTYTATAPLLPPVKKTFDLASKGSTSFTLPAPPPLSTYHVVLSCKGQFNGDTVEFGHVEKDVTLAG